MAINSDSILKRKMSLTLGCDTHTAAASALFVVLLCAFEGLYLNAGISTAISLLVQTSDPVFVAVYAAYIGLSLYLVFAFTAITISARWPYKVALIAVFGFATLVEYSYHNALGRFTTVFDVLAAMSATPDQRSDSLGTFISFASAVPIAVLISFCIAVGRRKKQTFGAKAVAVFSIAAAAFMLNLSYVDRLLFDRQFYGASFTAFGQTIADFAMYVPAVEIGPPVREQVLTPTGREIPRPTKNIVLIFDESIRADHLSLNGYSRKTTPYLEDLAKKGYLINWGTAVSASTSSHPSYNAFITGITPDEYAATDIRSINSLPTIFQYARAMGYRTHLFDGQMKEYWGGTPDDLNYIDEYVSLAEIDSPDRIEDWERGSKITYDDLNQNGLKQWEIDNKIAGMVKERFTASTGNFIFIYKRGAHFPYEKNYPEDETHWKPIYKFKEQWEIPPADMIDAVKNSYDNSIKFNLDSFFKNLADDYSRLPNGTVILYTSDHGESFFANGRAGHGGDTREEALVPLFAIGLDSSSIDTGFAASHHDLFGTILDLMGFRKEERNGKHQRSLLNAKKGDSLPRSFNIPTGRKIAFDK